MRILIFIAALMSSTFAQNPPIEPGVSQELAKWRAAHYSDVRYKLNLTIEKMSPVLRGTLEIRVNVSPQSVPPASAGGGAPGAKAPPIILDWRKIKGHEEKSTIANVSINGREVRVTPSGVITPEGLTLTAEESNEHLIFRDGVVAGENVIKLDFTSPILPSGSAITRYIDKEDGSEYIYSLFVPSDASTAFPVFDQPDLKARFELSVTAPTGWTVVSNSPTPIFEIFDGGGISRPQSPANTLRVFPETKPISTYVFAFAAGPWLQVSPETLTATGRNPSGSEGVLNAEGGRRNAESKNVKQELKEAYRNWLNTDVSMHMTKEERDQFLGVATTSSTHIYIRKSQLAKFQPHAAEVFRLNREAIKYFEEYFDYKFPFPKYDLVLIPEFPFGGMEHAGATFLREASIIFPQEPTKNDHVNRATLIFHEAAHQWFGDTVTMRWFDDLWLKEGFATFTAYKAMEKIMPEMNSWKVFYERIKQGAYQTDSTKGTTAIYQPIANLSAAKSAYGNIVYNKAPAFLRQAEFYLGEDKFRTAVRSFLKKHEFGNAGWEDLVREFENVKVAEIKSTEFYEGLSEPDKSELEKFTRWSISTEWVKFWVAGRGMPIYRISPNVLESNRLVLVGGPTGGHTIFMTHFSQDGTVENLNWLQNVRVLKAYENGEREEGVAELGNRRYATLPDEEQKGPRKGEFTFSGVYSGSEITTRKAVFVFPNYNDYGYGIFLLDRKSRDYIQKNIHNERDPFLRSMMWGALWDSVREGELDPKEYAELALRVLPAKAAEDESTIASILNRVSTAMTYYMSDAKRNELTPRVEQMLIEKMSTAPTLGQRITYYRAFLNVASSEKARSLLKDVLNLKFQISDLRLKTKDRFDIVTKLASLGDPEAETLLADLEKTETSDDAKRYAYAARAAFPTKETKEKYWNDFINNKQISESWIEAAFGPFNSVRHADLTLPYLERALKELPNHKRNRKIFFVNGWLGAFIGGQRSEEALKIVNKFLADNPNLDRDLRLKILENVDIIERAVKIRAKYP